MRQHTAQTANVQGQTVAFFFENPIRCCRCIQGRCQSKRGCFKVKTEEHGLACHVMDRFNASVESTSNAIFENRAEIIKGVVLNKTDNLAFQDNLFLTIREQRKAKKDQWEWLLKAKDCKPSKSGRYHRGSAKWKAQKLIDEALMDLRVSV